MNKLIYAVIAVCAIPVVVIGIGALTLYLFKFPLIVGIIVLAVIYSIVKKAEVNYYKKSNVPSSDKYSCHNKNFFNP